MGSNRSAGEIGDHGNRGLALPVDDAAAGRRGGTNKKVEILFDWRNN
jgi:hypothetical protein